MRRNAKLTWEKVDEIRRRYEVENISQAALGKEYGVSQIVANRVIRFLAWKPDNDPRGKHS